MSRGGSSGALSAPGNPGAELDDAGTDDVPPISAPVEIVSRNQEILAEFAIHHHIGAARGERVGILSHEEMAVVNGVQAFTS